MNKNNKSAHTPETAVVCKQNTNKSVTHFNWFARFETQQPRHKESLKS